MTPRPATQALLTDAELELMLILWRLKEASVRDVLATLPPSRHMAYTTASTVIRILEKKGLVVSRKQGKAHLYQPLLSKTDYEARTLDHVVERVFDKTPVALVARLIEDEGLTAAELAEISALIARREQDSKS